MAKRDEGAELSADEKFELLLEVLAQKQAGGITKDDLQQILAVNATAVQKALKPENETHPNISAFHPKGGPLLSLPYAVFYRGDPVHKHLETHHDRELELMAQVQPGEYTVLRKDGTPMPVSVSAERDASGRITRLNIDFRVSKDEQALVPPIFVVLYQLVYPDNPRQRFVEAMTEHLQLVLPQAV